MLHEEKSYKISVYDTFLFAQLLSPDLQVRGNQGDGDSYFWCSLLVLEEEYGPCSKRIVVVNFCLCCTCLKNQLSGLPLFDTPPDSFMAGEAARESYVESI